MKTFSKQYGPWALVTGASSGIGRAFCEQLAARGIHIVAVARNQDNLRELRSTLTREHGVQVNTIALDLFDPEAAVTLGELTKDIDIGLLVANAGIQNHGLFSENTAQEERKLLALNVTGPMQLSHTFAKRLARRGKGGILFTSSGFGYQGVPYFANYSASKAYLITLGEALHVELKPAGVDVTVISPGYTNTPMANGTPIDFDKLPIPQQEPEVVARVGLNALGKKATVVPGVRNKSMIWINRIMPRIWPTKLLGVFIGHARTAHE